MKIKKNNIAFLAIISLLAGCAGRTANPVRVSQIGDDNMSCNSLLSAMDEADSNIHRLLPKSEKTGQNVGLGVAGVLFFPAWFFMDFSEAEKIEIDAYRQRYNHLARIYNDKGCSAKGQKKKEYAPFFKNQK